MSLIFLMIFIASVLLNIALGWAYLGEQYECSVYKQIITQLEYEKSTWEKDQGQ